MGGVLSGSRGWRGGKRPTSHLPAVRLTHADRFSLKYRAAYIRIDDPDYGIVVHGSREWFVGIEWTSQNYGGQRRWLVCPCCQTRRVALYINGKELACRVCLNLRYESTHDNRRERAMRTADRIRTALGWQPGILNPNGKKPKNMHWRTYQRLTGEIEAITNGLLGALPDWIDRLERGMDLRRQNWRVGGG